ISKNVISNNLRSDICNLKCAKRSVFCVFVAIEVQHSRLFVNHGLEVYGPAPEGVHMFKCFAGVSHLEFSTLVAVLQVKFAVAVVISVLNFKVGKSKVSHVRDELVADSLPTFLSDCPLFFLDQFIHKQIEFLAQLLGEIVPQKRNVVLEFTHFKNLVVTFIAFASKPLLFLGGRFVPTTLYVFVDLV